MKTTIDRILQKCDTFDTAPYIALLGPRACGKSFVVDQLLRELRGPRFRDRVLPLHVDLRSIQLGPEEEMQAAIAQQIIKEARQCLQVPLGMNGHEVGIPEILECISRRVSTSLLLIIDHLECLPRFMSRAISRQLRAMYEQIRWDPVLKKIGVIVAGALSLFDLKHETDSAFEFFDREILPPSNQQERIAGVAYILGPDLPLDPGLIRWLAEYIGPEPPLLLPLVTQLQEKRVYDFAKAKRMIARIAGAHTRILENIGIHVWQDPVLFEIAHSLVSTDAPVSVYEPAVDIDKYQLLGVVRLEGGRYVFRNELIAGYVRGLFDLLGTFVHALTPAQVLRLQVPAHLPGASQVIWLEAYERALLHITSLTEARKVLVGAWKLLRHGEEAQVSIEVSVDDETKAARDITNNSLVHIGAAEGALLAARRLQRPAFGWDKSHLAVCIPASVEHATVFVTCSLERGQIHGSFAESALMPWFRLVESCKVPLVANVLTSQLVSVRSSRGGRPELSIERETDSGSPRQAPAVTTTGPERVSFELLTNVLVELAFQRNDPDEFLRDMIERAELATGIRIAALRNVQGSTDIAIRHLLRWAYFAGASPDRPSVPILQRLTTGIIDELGVPQRRLVLAALMQTGNYETGGIDVIAEQYAVPAQATSVRIDPSSSLNIHSHSADVELQSLIKRKEEFLDVGFLKAALERATAVCLVTVPEGQRTGTGVLIRKDLVLTNYHVLDCEGLKIEEVAEHTSIRFGFIGSATGKAYQLSSKAIVAASPTRDLDFVLLRLNESVNDVRPLDIPQSLGNHPVGSPVHILQHPLGGSMKLSISHNGVARVFEEKGFIHYATQTAGGSSGAPCFDASWNLIAIHRAEKATSFGSIREGVLLQSIVTKASL